MRRLRLGLAFLAARTAVVATAAATRVETRVETRDDRRPSSSHRVRGRATLEDGNARALRENAKKAPSKHTPQNQTSESEPDHINSSDEDETESYWDKNATELPDQFNETSNEPSATPTLVPSPLPLQSTEADTAIAPGASANTTAPSGGGMSSSSTDPGSLIGFSMSGMLLVVVLLFLTKQKQRKRTSDTTSLTVKEAGRVEQGDHDTDIDHDEYDDQDGAFAGVYKLREHSQWNAFLQAMGVSWAVRSAAVRARPVQFVTHKGNSITIKFKGVPRMTYMLGGPTVTSVLGSQPFTCAARYTEENDGFEVRKEALDGGLNLHFRWILLDDNETVRLNLTAIFPEEDRHEQVQCTQFYQRIGEF
jgi:hypothetical protein